MKIWRFLAGFFLALTALTVFALSAFAGDPYITYEGGAENGYFTFGPAVNGDLFLNMKDMMPGDSRQQYIRVCNNATEPVMLVLYVRSDWNAANDVETERLKNWMTVTYTVENGNDAFDPDPQAAVLPDGWKMLGQLDTTGSPQPNIGEGWTYLGVLHHGGAATIKAQVDFDIWADNSTMDCTGKVDFLIQAASATPEDKPGVVEIIQQILGTSPHTGDNGEPVQSLSPVKCTAAALLLLLLLLLPARRKKRKETKDDGQP